MNTIAIVTGCAGFIGSHLCEALLKDSRRVFGIDNLDDYYDGWIKRANLTLLRKYDRFRFVPADILRAPAALYQNADTVFHMAARPGVRISIGRGELYIRNNVLGTQVVLNRATEAGVGTFVVASSSSVYGNIPVPFAEDGPTEPISPYGASKLAAEAMCRTHVLANPVSITSLRFFCVYGPRCRPDLVLSKFAKKIDAGKPIPVYGDPKAISRDYTYIDDIVQGILKAEAFTQGSKGRHTVVNLGNGKPIRLDEAIETIADAVGKKPVYDQQPANPADAQTTHACTKAAESLLDWRATTDYADGVARYIEWFRENQAVAP